MKIIYNYRTNGKFVSCLWATQLIDIMITYGCVWAHSTNRDARSVRARAIFHHGLEGGTASIRMPMAEVLHAVAAPATNNVAAKNTYYST